jgi:predicted HTH domain antitoxin
MAVLRAGGGNRTGEPKGVETLQKPKDHVSSAKFQSYRLDTPRDRSRPAETSASTEPTEAELERAKSAACCAQHMAGADVTIPVALPSTALAEEPAEAIERRLRLLWALDEIRAGRATRVRAATWLGLSIDEFLKLAEAHGLPAFDYDPDDFKSELASLK